MSQERTLLTQAQINELNAIISLIGANLNTHVNDSLSKAHGFNAYSGVVYQDSAGDTYSQSGFGIAFDFGTPPNITRLYVPAQITAIGPGRTGNGVTVTAVSSSGASTSPGVPLNDTPLATVFTQDTSNSLNIYNDMLLAHTASVASDTGASQVHGGLTFSLANTIDSIGHLVGRYLVTMSINGTAFNLVADVLPGGPPQPPRVSPTPTIITANQQNWPFAFNVNHGWTGGFGFLDVLTGGISTIISPAPGFSDDYGVVVTPVVAPAGCTFKWQYYLGGTFEGHDIPNNTFTTIPFINHPSNGFQVYTNAEDGSIYFMSGWVGGDTYDTVKTRLTVSDVAASTQVATNGAALTCTFGVNNHTRCCWFAQQANITRRLSDEEWKMMGVVERFIYKTNRRLVAFYIKHGEELTKRMQACGVAQPWFEDFIDRVVKLILENRVEDAADYYISNIIEMASKHWPDCAHPGLKATREARKLVVA